MNFVHVLFIAVVYYQWSNNGRVDAILPPTGIEEAYVNSLNRPGKAVGWNFVSKTTGGMNMQVPPPPTDPAAAILNRSDSNAPPPRPPVAPVGQTYAAIPNSEPVASFYASDSLVFEETGIEADSDVATGKWIEDRSIRLVGMPHSCLKVDGLSEPVAKCLSDPVKCSDNAWGDGDIPGISHNGVTGFSFSIWVNIPKSFGQHKEYILDTGGNEYGGKGVSIYTVGSLDGKSFTQQIVVIVSNGTNYWKVKLNGMTTPHAWNNIAFRWSPDPGVSQDTNKAPSVGLQVFVNKTACGWTRSAIGSLAGGLDQVGPRPEDRPMLPQMTFGCALDGHHGVKGRLDQPSFWMWFLKHSGSDFKPGTGQYHQLEMFDGSLTFRQAAPSRTLDPARVQAEGFTPWQWSLEREYFGGDVDRRWLDDVAPALQDDSCTSFNAPSAWGDSPYYPNRQSNKHPIDCAVTIAQIRDAMGFSNADYTPEALARALVRVVNKNQLGPEGLQVVFHDFFPTLLQRLKQDPTGSMKGDNPGEAYANIIYTLSRLQEPEVYEKMWKDMQVRNENSTQQKIFPLSISAILLSIETFLIELAEHMQSRLEIFVASNNTMILISRMQGDDFGHNLLRFPIPLQHDEVNGKYYRAYSRKKVEKEMVEDHRYEHWLDLDDELRFPIDAAKEYKAYDNPKISVIRMINKHLHKMLPNNIDSRVQGVEGHKFFLNSHVITFSLRPKPPDTAILLKYPIEFTVKHIEPQHELPYMKGAVLCAHWVYNQNDSMIGGWDTGLCKILHTNDTHTECSCSHMSDYAVLFEDYEPSGKIGDAAYYFCYGLYAVSILCLIIYLMIIISNERLHYELHIIGMNFGFALLFALALYLSTLLANEKRVACLMVSVFMHYSYTAAYLWCLMMAHYIFRAITKGKLGGVLPKYCFIAWGLPAVVVVILTAVDVTRYGIGERCLGAQTGYFLWVYIGVFMLFAACVCPLFAIAFCNLNKNPIKDNEDRNDVTFALYGVAMLWPFIMILWIMAILVYLKPVDSPIPDFLFELFNSIQGLLLFLFIGVLVPSFRHVLLCKKTEPLTDLTDDELKKQEDLMSQPTDGHGSSMSRRRYTVTPAPEDPAPEPPAQKKEGFFGKLFGKSKNKEPVEDSPSLPDDQPIPKEMSDQRVTQVPTSCSVKSDY